MFETFQRNFGLDPEQKPCGQILDTSMDLLLQNFFASFGGRSFARGLYRTIGTSELPAWNGRIEAAFPEFAGTVTAFGYDWLGRAFALDIKRSEDGQPGVVLFEPGTGQALEIPENLIRFHDIELIEQGDAALAASFYKKWLASGGATPRHDQCVGYRRPLFLDGADDIGNLEISDLDVYWHIAGQLIRKTRGLPPGTEVRVNLD